MKGNVAGAGEKVESVRPWYRRRMLGKAGVISAVYVYRRSLSPSSLSNNLHIVLDRGLAAEIEILPIVFAYPV
jgi:hypothetical protein